MNQSQQQQRQVANGMRMTRNCQLHRHSHRKSESDTMKTWEMGGTSLQLLPSVLGLKDDEQQMLMLAFKALVWLALFIGVTSAAGSVRLIIGLGLDINTSKNKFIRNSSKTRDPTKQYSNITPRASSY